MMPYPDNIFDSQLEMQGYCSTAITDDPLVQDELEVLKQRKGKESILHDLLSKGNFVHQIIADSKQNIGIVYMATVAYQLEDVEQF